MNSTRGGLYLYYTLFYTQIYTRNIINIYWGMKGRIVIKCHADLGAKNVIINNVDMIPNMKKLIAYWR